MTRLYGFAGGFLSDLRGRYVLAQLGLVEEVSTMEFSAIEFRLIRCNENVCNIRFETCLVSTSSVASIGRFSF